MFRNTINEIKKNKELSDLSKKMVEIRQLNQYVNALVPTAYNSIKQMHSHSSSDVTKLVMNNNFSHNIANSYVSTHTRIAYNVNYDYKYLTSLNQFNDNVIEYNIKFNLPRNLLSKDKDFAYFDIQAQARLAELKLFRDLCAKGDLDGLCQISAMPYMDSSDTTDEFNGIVFALKKKC